MTLATPVPGTLPVWQQIAELLVRDIAIGRLIDGERLPPERDMAAELGISVGTLRRALAELEAQGLLDRVQGSGNYVRARADTGSIYALFRLELVEGGGAPTAEVLSVDRLPKPESLPPFGPHDEAHRIRRLRSLDDRPAAVEEIWLDASRIATLAASDLPDSLYLFYRQRLDLRIGRVEDRIGQAPCPAWAPPVLGKAPGTPLPCVTRISHAQDGTPVETSRSWYDPDVVQYVARWK